MLRKLFIGLLNQIFVNASIKKSCYGTKENLKTGIGELSTLLILIGSRRNLLSFLIDIRVCLVGTRATKNIIILCLRNIF